MSHLFHSIDLGLEWQFNEFFVTFFLVIFKLLQLFLVASFLGLHSFRSCLTGLVAFFRLNSFNDLLDLRYRFFLCILVVITLRSSPLGSSRLLRLFAFNFRGVRLCAFGVNLL